MKKKRFDYGYILTLLISLAVALLIGAGILALTGHNPLAAYKALLGGAFSNGLTPTTTLGCGSWGNNSISENLSYKHMINVIRIGYNNGGTQPSDEEIWG